MVIGPSDLGPQADIVFVIEGTAVNGAYFNDVKEKYIIPTIEYFSQLKLEERDYPFEKTSVQYGLVVYHAADRLPSPNVDCYGPYTNRTKLLTAMERIELIGGHGESCANVAEGLATALQCFEDLQQKRDNPGHPSQKHCILVCNSPPYNHTVTESPIYSGQTADQLCALLAERGIHLSILSPRKIPSLFKLYDKAGGDLSISQTKHYSKDPRHLVLLNGYSLKEQPVSPLSAMPGHQANQQTPAPQQQAQPGQTQQGQQQTQQTPQSQQNATGQPVQSGQSPQQATSLQIPPMSSPSTNVGSPMGSSNAGGPFRQNAGGPQGMGVNPQQQQQQQPGPQQQQGQPGPQQQQGQPGAQQQMVVPPGPRPQHNMVGNMYQQQQPPVYPPMAGGRAHGLERPWRMPPQRTNFMQPGQNFPGAANPQAGQNQTSPLLAQLQTPPGVNQAQHTAPFATAPQQMRMLMRPGGAQQGQGVPAAQQQQPQQQQQPTQQQQQQQQQPQQQQQQQQQPQQPAVQNPQVGVTSVDRQTIWSGYVEWSEKSKVSSETQKHTRQVLVHISTAVKDGEPEITAEGWPPKLGMQMMPKTLIGSIGGAYLKHSRSVVFHPQPSEALECLTKTMLTGYAGCIHISNAPSEIRVMLLLYAHEKKSYLGFIPTDQIAFVDRLRKVIQTQKKHPQSRGAQNQQGNVPIQQMINTTGAQQMMMSQTNTMAMVGGHLTQNVVPTGASAAQGGPGGGGPGAPGPQQQMVLGQQPKPNTLGVPIGGAQLAGTGQMGGPVPMGLAGMDGQMTRPQGPTGPAGPSQGGTSGLGMNQTIMRPEYSEAARKQNLSTIEHLHQSLQAAQFKEQQYKSLEMHQQMQQQRLSQQTGQPQNPNQQRLMRPTSNPGLRLLLQQQPQYRMQQHMQQQQQQQQQQQMMRGPAPGGIQQQFDDSSPFDY